jgi:serine phosphatase RsbU (regulator of sigma subunit)
MQKAIRTFIGKVLLIHLVLLLLLLVIVYSAARSIYGKAQEHALDQARDEQALVAVQTSGAVQSFYSSILSDLQLLRPVESNEGESTTAPAESESAFRPPLSLRGPIAAPLLSKQLQGRVSHLFIVEKTRLHVQWIGIQPTDGGPTPQEIIVRLGAWMRSLQQPAIDSFVQFGDAGFSVVAIPVGVRRNMLLVAAVPGKRLQTLFLDQVSASGTSSGAFLLDDRMTAMAASLAELVGADLASATDPALMSAIADSREQGKPEPVDIHRPFRIGPERYPPSLITIEPMNVGGERWAILIVSPSANADRVVAELFHEAVKWCIFLVVSITALLASTSVQLIRGRIRIEHERLEMMERELKQAREIQLAWLPPPAPSDGNIDIATLNQPASHISGDFYNFFNLPDGRIVVSIGDVTGHGMAAAFLMATTQLLVRNTMPRVAGPADCLAEVNRQLCVQMFNGQFVTMQILVLDCQAGKVEVATAGHPAPLLSAGNSFIPMALEPQLVLGVEKDTKYRSQTFPLQSRWSILLYTDGVVEVERDTGERMGFDRLQSALHGPYPTAQGLLDAALRTVDRFRGNYALRDDLTLVAVQRPGSA